MGSVYRCHNALSERIQGAIKVMDRHRADVSRDRFIREVEALASLRHESVVRILGFGEAPEHRAFYIAMELVQGDSLAKRINAGPWPWPGPREVFLKLAHGLAHAHGRGIAHRDIKPQNLMFGEDGSACIIDFGISAAEGRTSLTSEGMFLGTVTHMAPELFGQGAVDPMKADIYALGQVFYEVLTGSRAFSAQAALTVEQRMIYVMAAKMNSETLDPGPESPPALRALIREVTCPDPARRTPDLQRFIAALEAVPLEPGQPRLGQAPREEPQLPLDPTLPLPSARSGAANAPLPDPATQAVAPPPPVVPTTGSGRRPDLGIPTRAPRRAPEPTGPIPGVGSPAPDDEEPPPPAVPRSAGRSTVLGAAVGLLVGIPLGLGLLGWQLGWFEGDPPPATPVAPEASQAAPPSPPATAETTADEPAKPEAKKPEAKKAEPTKSEAATSTETRSAPRTTARQTTETRPSTQPPAPAAEDVPMGLSFDLSLEGELYAPALSPLFEGRRSAFEACFMGAGAQGSRTDLSVRWSLAAGAITDGPSASGGSTSLHRCVEGIVRRIPFDATQSGAVSLGVSYAPLR